MGSLHGQSVLHKRAIAENRYLAEPLSCLVRLNNQVDRSTRPGAVGWRIGRPDVCIAGERCARDAGGQTVVTDKVTLVHWDPSEVSVFFSAVSTVRPQRILTAVHSRM